MEFDWVLLNSSYVRLLAIVHIAAVMEGTSGKTRLAVIIAKWLKTANLLLLNGSVPAFLPPFPPNSILRSRK